MTSETLFISDLHLSAITGDRTARFLDFLNVRARGAHRLYILGDLFDAYIGDDDDSSPNRPVKHALRTLTESGTEVYFMHGNRDFLVGERFFAETGAMPLDDYATVDLYGKQALITHGDLLCTDDTRYQDARRRVRAEAWKQAALAKPLWIRQCYARWYRFRSGLHKRGQEQEIMDVNLQTVVDVMTAHGIDLLIHGHTHRPACHTHGERTRWVLPEWTDRASLLSWNETGTWAFEHLPD